MRILIADDHAIVRQGLRSLIENCAGMQVIGEAQNGQEAVRLAQELFPDVVIMDVTMPELSGVEATQRIRRQNSAVKVIILSMHPDQHIVKESLKAGAQGYVLKSCVFDELRRALEITAAGGHYLSPQITDVIVEDCARDFTEGTASSPPSSGGTSGQTDC